MNKVKFSKYILQTKNVSDCGNISAPGTFFYILIAIVLVLPNLVYSGTYFNETLHIAKWLATFIPLAILSLIIGFNLTVKGSQYVNHTKNVVFILLSIMLCYLPLQLCLCDIMSTVSWLESYLFLLTLSFFYFAVLNFFNNESAFYRILLLSSISGVLSVIAAELQLYGYCSYFPFIMDVPGHFVANTGQQNILGVWLAIAVLNTYILLIRGERQKIAYILLSFNTWGLVDTSSRSGLLSLLSGIIIFSMLTTAKDSRNSESFSRNVKAVAIILFIVLLNISLGMTGYGRGNIIADKSCDAIENITSVGARREIWETTFEIIKKYNITGVGLGNYKWHYLEGQKDAWQHNHGLKWQYTLWAHNEYLQIFAESGFIGAILLLSILLLVTVHVLRHIAQGNILTYQFLWGVSLLTLISVDALFTRPFHRIEIALWFVFALALLEGEMCAQNRDVMDKAIDKCYRIYGYMLTVIAICGVAFLTTGTIGSRYLRLASNSADIERKKFYIEKAYRIPMTKEIADEKYAFYLVELAGQTCSPEDFCRSVNRMYTVFEHRPNSALFLALKDISVHFNFPELTKALKKYDFDYEFEKNQYK